CVYPRRWCDFWSMPSVAQPACERDDVDGERERYGAEDQDHHHVSHARDAADRARGRQARPNGAMLTRRRKVAWRRTGKAIGKAPVRFPEGAATSTPRQRGDSVWTREGTRCTVIAESLSLASHSLLDAGPFLVAYDIRRAGSSVPERTAPDLPMCRRRLACCHEQRAGGLL